jgi:NAD(P) transhydrogenase subunit alpha
MARGSVIVDMAAEQGGNCPLTERDRVVEKHGVTMIGHTDLPSRMARTSSELYAGTVFNLVESLFPKDKGFHLDLDDDIHRGVLVLKDGTLMWPPPPARPGPKPAGAPAPAPAPAPAANATSSKHAGRPSHPPRSAGRARAAMVVASAVLAAVALFGPPALLPHLTVFLLACVVGWHVIWNVTPALHTPLMSVTNAISGIILVGAMVVLGSGAGLMADILAAVAILLASINVAGGFLVTQRMLRMFRK